MPLMYPPYSNLSSTSPNPISPTNPSPMTPYFQSERSLLSRLYLPADHHNAICPVLALAIAAVTSPYRSQEALGFAIDSGREILATKITTAGFELSGLAESEEHGRRRVRRAMDTAQASAMLGAFYHFNGKWAEVRQIFPWFPRVQKTSQDVSLTFRQI